MTGGKRSHSWEICAWEKARNWRTRLESGDRRGHRRIESSRLAKMIGFAVIHTVLFVLPALLYDLLAARGKASDGG
jgi:hypothetical protein